MQGQRGTLPGSVAGGGIVLLQPRLHRGTGRLHRCPLRATEGPQRAEHVRQPGQGTAAGHQQPHLQRRKIRHWHRTAGGTGQHEQISARWTDAQRIAQPGRQHRNYRHHRYHGQWPGLSDPVAQRHRQAECQRHQRQLQRAAGVWTATAIQPGEPADGGHHPGMQVAGGKADHHRRGHTETGAQREQPAPGRQRPQPQQVVSELAPGRWRGAAGRVGKGRGKHAAFSLTVTRQGRGCCTYRLALGVVAVYSGQLHGLKTHRRHRWLTPPCLYLCVPSKRKIQ